MNDTCVELENIYGLSAKSHEFDLFINMTAHLSYLFGWNEQETSKALTDLSECKIETSKISPEEIKKIWVRLSRRPLNVNFGVVIESQKIVGDLLVHWKVVAENVGITNISLSENFEQCRRDALDGVGYEATLKTKSRAESLPEEIFDTLLSGPVIQYLDVLSDFAISEEGMASWRDRFPGASPQRSAMYAHGLLPTMEFYATPKELESFQNITWRNDDKFLSAFFSGKNLEFGFLWEHDGALQSFHVTAAGLNGRSSLGLAMALGMIRVNFFDTSMTPMRHVFSRTLYVSTEQCSRFFEAGLHNSISNDLVPPPSADFHAIDQARHAGIVPLSHLLRQELPCDSMGQETVATFDRLFDEWRTNVGSSEFRV